VADFDRWVSAQKEPPALDASVVHGRQVFESTACVNCHTIRGTAADGRFGPDLTHLMTRETIGAGVAMNTRDHLKVWVSDPSVMKPGALMPAMNLGDKRPRRSRRLPGDLALMEMRAWQAPSISKSLLGAVDDPQALPLVGKLHEWVVTVDHKRLGLMYIVGGLFFFLIAGLQAATIRLQLAVPDGSVVPPQVFNRLMTMHGTRDGFPGRDADPYRLLQLPDAADDWARPRPLAFPRLNAFGFWLWFFGAILLYFSYIGGDGLYGAGQCPRRRMVRIRSPSLSCRSLARQQY